MWSGDRMTFFPPDPEQPETDEPERSMPRWWGPPEDELPVLLPAAEILATTEHMAVALIGAFVHREGVELRIERRLRRRDLPLRAWNDLVGKFAEHSMFGPPEDLATRLRFGLVLGDGEQVLDGRPYDPGADPNAPPERHSLMRNGGSGGGSEHSHTASEGLWLWPLPPEGPIELVMQWPALGIEETRAVLDGTSIRELAQRAVTLWPAD